MAIGTSMFMRPWRRAAQAERKKTPPEKNSAGMAISADSQWNMSRVAPSAPDHTETDSSMMLPAAKPATATARISSLSVRSFSSPPSNRCEA